MFSLRQTAKLSVAILSSTCIASFAGDVSSNTVEMVRNVAVVVANSAAETGALRDMAVIAVRNAIAAKSDADESFLAAVKSGDKPKQMVAMKKRNAVSESTEESMNMLTKIADYTGEVAEAAGQAKQYEKEVSTATTERDAASKLKQIQKLSISVLKTVKKVQALAEILKKQWLIPLAPQPTTPVSPVTESK